VHEVKKGVNLWAFPERLSLREIVEVSKKYGFQGIELCVGEEGDFSLHLPPARWESMRAEVSDGGLEIRSIASGLWWKYNLVSSDEKVAIKAKDVGKKLIEIAHFVGARSVLVIPGYVNIPWEPQAEVVSYDFAWERAISTLQELALFAQGTEVLLGVENVWNKFLLSPLEFRQFIDEINHPQVRVHLDTGNMLPFGYPEQWIHILGNRIVAVHVKDFKVAVGNIHGFCLPLEGDVNWPRVMEALKAINYDDYLIAEFIPPYRYHREALLMNLSANLDCLLKMA